jgi:hypothetical protein
VTYPSVNLFEVVARHHADSWSTVRILVEVRRWMLIPNCDSFFLLIQIAQAMYFAHSELVALVMSLVPLDTSINDYDWDIKAFFLLQTLS